MSAKVFLFCNIDLRFSADAKSTPSYSSDLHFHGTVLYFDLSSNQNQKPFEKKFADLAARAAFVSSFLLQK